MCKKAIDALNVRFEAASIVVKDIFRRFDKNMYQMILFQENQASPGFTLKTEKNIHNNIMMASLRRVGLLGTTKEKAAGTQRTMI